jgi:DNA-binding CsgD family transcriptional regulator
MDEIEDLPEGERRAVAELLGGLTKVLDNPYLLRRQALEGMVNLLSIRGYCTVLWMNRFFSKLDRKGNKGRVYHHYHANNPPAWLERLWELHIRQSSSIIEDAIYERYSDVEVGFATRAELVDPDSFRQNIVGALARRAHIGDMGYLWVQAAKNDMWVFCLRKKRHEPDFTVGERVLVRVIGGRLLEMRRNWHLRSHAPLTEREMEVFDLRCRGLTVGGIAEALNLSYETVKHHIKKIRNKLKDEMGRIFGRVDSTILMNQLNVLTPHQRKMLKLLSEERSQAEVARELKTTVPAVKSQLRVIYARLKSHKLQEALNTLSELINR